MADSTIDSELIVLHNPWGAPNVDPSLLDNILGAQHHNVETPFFRVGAVVELWNDSGVAGKDGYSQFVYLQVVVNAGLAFAAKQVCVPDSATVWYQVTNDPDDCLMNSGTGNSLFGVMPSVMTTLYYGWLWCGGVCPEEHVSDFAGNFATNDSLVVGNFATSNLAADSIGFGPVDDTTGSQANAIAGFSLATDA